MDKLLECAKIILKNTNVYLQQCLECFISDYINCEYDTEFQDLLMVFTRIAEDGFDVSGFGLYEIPHPSVYIFYNSHKNQMFDVCLNNFCNTGEMACIAYTAYTDIGFDNIAAKTIKEAIEKYDKSLLQ